MNTFKSLVCRLASFSGLVAVSLGIVQSSSGQGIQIEQVLRDFQARHQLVTGTNVPWLPCLANSTPAPPFPKNGFYGNLNENPDEGVRILTNLVERFYTNNVIYTAFVKAPNGYSSIENVTTIDNYASSDMTFVSWNEITTETLAQKLQVVADQVAKLILIKTNATQVLESDHSRASLVEGYYGVENCATIQACAETVHSTVEWTHRDFFTNCAIWFTNLLVVPEYTKIGIHFETTTGNFEDVRAYNAGGRNTRGKIRADLTPYKAGIAHIFLKLAAVSTNSAHGWPNDEFFSYTASFGQNRPTIADENKWGIWSDGSLQMGQESTSGIVTYSDGAVDAAGDCIDNGVTLVGWELQDALAVIQPDFYVKEDPQDCCSGCSQEGCEAGGMQTSVSSVHVSINLGPDGFGGSAGSLNLRADVPSTLLAKPIALQSSVASNVEVIRDSSTNQIQFKTSQVLVNVKTNNAYYYTISVYTNAGSLSGGFYVPVGSAHTTIIVENPDSGSASNRLKFTRTVDGSSLVTEYTHTAATDQWEMSTGGGLRKESRSSVWSGNDRYETNIVKNSANDVVYKQSDKYTLFSWGEEIVQSIVDPDGSKWTNSWTYYTNSASDGGAYRQAKTQSDRNGHWTTYKYDSAGRETNRVTQFMNSAVDSAENLNRVVSTLYSTNTPQITLIEKLLGTEISRQYRVISLGEVRDIRCQTAGAAWNASDNLVTITRKYTNGSFAGQLYRVVNPDDTVQIHLYSTNATEKTTVALSGVADGGSETNITRGTINTTVVGLAGETRSHTVTYRMSHGSDFTVDQDIYTYTDQRHRSYSISHLDGTTSSFVYECCGMSSQTDRDGTVTIYIYDDLKRQIGSTRNGISATNLLDANGAELATVRYTNGNAMTLSTANYDQGGLMTNSVNALQQTTSYRDFISSGLPTRETTYPDTSVQTEVFARDGTLIKVTGGPARNMLYTNGVETGGADTGKFYQQETKLDTAGSVTGEWTRRYFDAARRVYKTMFSDNAYSVRYFNAKGQLTNEVDPDGVSTLYFYNDLGELSFTVLDMDRDGQIDWAGTDRITEATNDVLTSHNTTVRRSRQYVWKTDGVDIAALASTMEISVDGLQTWTDSFGRTNHTYTKYAGSGVLYETNMAPAGHYSISRFEGGSLTAVTLYDNSGTQVGGTTYGYDPHGRQTTTIDARNGATTQTYNNADQVASVTTPSPSQVTSNYFDSMGRVWKVGLADGTSVTNEFNSAGDLRKTYGSRTYPVEYHYDAHGRATNMTTWTASPSTGAASTKWKYNERGFVTNKVYADGNGPKYTYTAAGRLNTRAWARGITTTYAYNNAGELRTTVYSDGTPGVTNTYDRRGRLTGAVYGTNNAAMVYGDAGELLSETINGIMITNIYDAVLRRRSVALTEQASTLVSYGYDPASRLGSVTNGSYTSTYAYHIDSPLVSSITFKDGSATRLATAKSYDNLNRLTSISSTPQSGATISFNYGYNSANQRTSVTNSDSRWVFDYDPLGQVTSGKRYWTDGTPVAGQQFHYAFDDIGNRKYSGSGGDNYGANLRYSHYTANSLNQYISRTVPNILSVVGSATNTATVTVNDAPTHRKGDYYAGEAIVDNAAAAVYQGITNLAVVNQPAASDIVTNIVGNLFVPKTPEAFTYDADGNLTNDGRWTYTWDPENRLTNMTANTTVPSAAKVQLYFAYDYRGRRTSKVVSTWDGSTYVSAYTNRFVYDEWNLLAELNHANALVRNFVWGTDLSGTMQRAGGISGLLGLTVSTNGTHIPTFDGNGNIVALVSATNGVESATYEYGVFGEPIRADGSAASNPFRFSTKYRDAETDQVYYGHRCYDPAIGRWLIRDPLAETDTPNLYAFVRNSPVEAVDLYGLITIGFYGWDGWMPGKNDGNKAIEQINKVIADAEPLFESASVSAAFKHLLKKLDSNKDGKYDFQDTQQEIRIYGWSWGGVSAVQLAEKINESPKFDCAAKQIKVVAVIDPVDTLRTTPKVPSNVTKFWNKYQTKGPGVPLKLHGKKIQTAPKVTSDQTDLNSTGTATTTKFSSNGTPVTIDHITIIWEVGADLLLELK